MSGITEAYRAWAADPAGARRMFKALAAAGDPRAQCAYGLMLGTGRGGGTDPALAVHFFRKAAEQEHPLACYSLGVALAEGRGAPLDAEAATAWMRRAADLGDKDALHWLGAVSADPATARSWWRRAAARGHLAAKHALGEALAATDLPAAAEWWLDAAIGGHEPSVEALAKALPAVRAAGTGAAAWVSAAFADDPADAAALKTRAVSAGHGRACLDLAARTHRGDVPGGVEARLVLLHRAADAGQEEAAHELGVAAVTGEGLPRDPTVALDWFRRAAAHGRPASLHALGALLVATGAVADGEEALFAAARAGHAGAMVALGRHLAGSDPVEALRWLLEATAAGSSDAAEAARELGAERTTDEIRRADWRTTTDGSVAAALLVERRSA